jgi:hypothetical protein
MSNILVSKLFHLNNNRGWPEHRRDEYFSSYQRMLATMIASAELYVHGLDEVVVSTGPKEDIQVAFRDHFFEIYDLWRAGNNILYCDADVVFLKPYLAFDQFEEFRMFNYTQPAATVDTYYGLSFPHFFNCAIRYYPQNMSDQIWQVGFDLIERGWNHDRWDTEQIIYNQMFWAQGLPLQSALKPTMNWQAFYLPSEKNNLFNSGVTIDAAQAIHFSGSRGIVRADEMNRVWETYRENKGN